MTLVLWESEDGDVGGIIEYATDLFEPDTIERLFRHFVALLEGIAANPLQRVSRLADAERGGTSAGDHRLECDGGVLSAALPARIVRRASAAYAGRHRADLQ